MKSVTRTINLRNRVLQDVSLSLLITKTLEHVVNNSLGELSLLALLLLLLVPHPAVKHGLELRREGDLLALNKGLRFELRGLLRQSEEALCDGRDVLHLRDRVNAGLDGFCVLRTSAVERIFDPVYVALSPLLVRLAQGLKTDTSISQNTKHVPKHTLPI